MSFLCSSLLTHRRVPNIELHLLLFGQIEKPLCGTVYAIDFLLRNSMVLNKQYLYLIMLGSTIRATYLDVKETNLSASIID